MRSPHCPSCLYTGKPLPRRRTLVPFLRLGRDFQLHLAVEGVDGGLAAQHGGVEVDVGGGVEVVAPAGEHGVGFYHEGDVQVARRAAVGTGSALPFQLDDLPVGHAGRHGDADVASVHAERLLVGAGRVAQAQVQLGGVVAALVPGGASAAAGAAAEEVFEEVRKASRTEVPVRTEVVPVAAAAEVRPGGEAAVLSLPLPCLFVFLGVLPVLAVSVILFPLFRDRSAPRSPR